jgi:hypothetical protein
MSSISKNQFGSMYSSGGLQTGNPPFDLNDESAACLMSSMKRDGLILDMIAHRKKNRRYWSLSTSPIGVISSPSPTSDASAEAEPQRKTEQSKRPKHNYVNDIERLAVEAQVVPLPQQTTSSMRQKKKYYQYASLGADVSGSACFVKSSLRANELDGSLKYPAVSQQMVGFFRSTLPQLSWREEDKLQFIKDLSLLRLWGGKKAAKGLIALRDFYETKNGCHNFDLRLDIEKELERIKKLTIEVVVGKATIFIKVGNRPQTVLLKKSFGFTPDFTAVTTIFKAYLPTKEAVLGQCTCKVVGSYMECIDAEYRSNRVVSVLRMDSYQRDSFRLIGTTLMAASMEYGIRKGSDHRMVLSAEADALGFYYKFGMRSSLGDRTMDRTMEEGSLNTYTGKGFPLHLPAQSLSIWKGRVTASVLFEKKK